MTREEIIKKTEKQERENYDTYAARAVPILQELNKGINFGLSDIGVEMCKNRIYSVIMKQIREICFKHSKLYWKYIDYDDFCSIAIFKALAPIDKYDPEKNVFSQFIEKTIIGAKREALENSNETTHHEYKMRKIIEEKVNELHTKYDRSASLIRDEEVALELKEKGISLKLVKKYRNSFINKCVMSIDNENYNFIERLPDKKASNKIYIKELSDSFNKMLESLDDIEKYLFLAIYDRQYSLSREDIMSTDLYRIMYKTIHPKSRKACENNMPIYEKHVTNVNDVLKNYGNEIGRTYTVDEFNDCLLYFIDDTRDEILEYLRQKYFK